MTSKLLLFPILLAFACLTNANAQATLSETPITQTLYASPSGISSNNGLSTATPKNLNGAISSAANTASKIILLDGDYRQWVSLPAGNTLLIIEAQNSGQAAITGSDLATNWTNIGGGLFTLPWTQNWGLSNTGFPGSWTAYNHRMEMLFINGSSLLQKCTTSGDAVATNTLSAGEFTVNEGSDLITFRPPAGVTLSLSSRVEITTRGNSEHLFRSDGRSNLVLRGIVFRHHGGTINQRGTFRLEGASGSNPATQIRIEDCSFTQNNGFGMQLNNTADFSVTRVNGSANGSRGAGGLGLKRGLIADSSFSSNNWRSGTANTGHDAAGFKMFDGQLNEFTIHATEDIVFLRCTFRHNNSVGFWQDYGGKNVTIDSCLFENNEQGGIMQEMTPGPFTVTNSVIRNNGSWGIQSYGAPNIIITNNYIYGTRSSPSYISDPQYASLINVVLDDRQSTSLVGTDPSRPSSQYGHFKGWVITGNVIQATDTGGAPIFYATDYGSSANPNFPAKSSLLVGLVSNNNTWWRAAGNGMFSASSGFFNTTDYSASGSWQNGFTHLDFAAWKSASGLDGASTWGPVDLSSVGDPTISVSPVITSNQSASGNTNSPFSYQILAANGPTSFSRVGGTLPVGIALNTSTGLLSGTPSQSGTFTPSFTATNSTGTSPAVALTITIAAAAPPAPTAPSSLSATANSSTQITLTWTDNATNETGFRIERSADGSTGWTQIATPAANATTFANTGLTASTTYFYRVRATNATGDSAYTSVANAATLAAGGGTLITIEAEDYDAGGQNVAYNDTDASNNGGAYRPAEGVDLESCSEGGFNIGWTSAGEWTQYTVTVSASGNYDITFRVSSSGGGGPLRLSVDGVALSGDLSVPSTGGWQNWTDVIRTGVSLTAGQRVIRITSVGGNYNLNRFTLAATAIPAPAAPSLLFATANSSTQLTLTWTDNANNETGFKIERSANGTTGWTQIAAPSANATTYADTGLATGTAYYYRIRATNSAGDSAYSNAANASTQAPPDVTSGLSARLAFDETSGTSAADSTGNGKTGTLQTGASFAAGKINNGVSLNGSSGFVAMPFVFDPSTQADLTVTAWVSLTTANAGPPTILQQVDGSGTGRTWLYRNAAGQLASFLGNAETTSNVTLLTGIWYHVALVKTGSSLQLYVNGEANGSPTTRTVESCIGAMRVGTHKSRTNQYWNGLIDEVRFYNRALSGSELATVAAWSPVALQSQTITFGALPSKTYGDPAFTLGATASSGLSVSYASSNPAVAAVSGNTVTLFGAGSTTITASQSGNASFSAAMPVPQTLTVNAAPTLATTSAALSGAAVGTASGNSSVFSAGVWEITGAGAGATGTADNVWFESKSVTGDFQVIARVLSLTGNGGAQPRAGVMVRATTATGSVAAFSTVGTSNLFHTGIRTATGGSLTATNPANPAATIPATWVLVERVGNKLRTAVSTDDINWIQISETIVAGLPSSLQVGLYVASGSTGVTAKATFEAASFEIVPITAVPSGRVGAWDFNEGSGTTTADTNGGGLSGVAAQGNIFPGWIVSGQSGSALDFNGTGQGLGIANNALLNVSSGMTLTLWVKPTTWDAGAWVSRAVAQRGLYGWNRVWALQKVNAADFSFRISALNGGSGGEVLVSTLPALNTWTHIAATYSSATGVVAIYYNGVLQGSATFPTGTAIGSSSEELRLGTGEGLGTYNGQLDGVRLFNRALTATELIALP